MVRGLWVDHQVARVISCRWWSVTRNRSGVVILVSSCMYCISGCNALENHNWMFPGSKYYSMLVARHSEWEIDPPGVSSPSLKQRSLCTGVLNSQQTNAIRKKYGNIWRVERVVSCYSMFAVETPKSPRERLLVPRLHDIVQVTRVTLGCTLQYATCSHTTSSMQQPWQ